MALVYCPDCGAQASEHATACVKCGFPISKIKTVHGNTIQSTVNHNIKPVESVSTDTGLIVTGYILAGISLLFFPFLFALAGLIIGIITISKGHTGHGVAHIVLSICFGILGAFLGALSELI
jgi:ribosomal protein L37E